MQDTVIAGSVEEGTQWSAAEWAAWVDARVAERERIYTTDPDELIAPYNREIGYTRDYHGREVLELLQNADDAGALTEGPCHAAIVLTPAGLCVANTGRPFTAAGIKSLMVSDNSPKLLDRARFIGNRGLGFRAILNWTDSPVISSGDLLVGFSRAFAERWLAALYQRHARIRAKVEDFRQGRPGCWPIALLSIPRLLDDGQIMDTDGSSPSGVGEVLTLCRGLRGEGYDTVVGIPFTSERAYNEVRAQLQQIGREALLFTKNLRQLTIRGDGIERIWSVQRADQGAEKLIEIRDTGAAPQVWHIIEDLGEIPAVCLRNDQLDAPAYEIKLALPIDEVVTPGVLYNYFPTQVRFPFPLVAHATLEVTNNRQNIVESAANRFLVGRFAQVMADAAEQSRESRYPWRSLSLLAPDGSLDPVLERLGFLTELVSAARSSRLVPVRGGDQVMPNEAMRLDAATDGWLPLSAFDDLVLRPPNQSLRRMLQAIGVPVMATDELRRRLDSISPSLSLEERSTLIAGLVSNGLMPGAPAPSLLVDTDGEVIPAGSTTFLPPAEDVTFRLPAWLEFRMLNHELMERLRGAPPVSTRVLADQLRMFALREYALGQVASAVSSGAEMRAKNDPKHARDYRLDAIHTIFALYRQGGEGTIPSRPATLHLPLPHRGGGFVPADDLYFGKEYSAGQLTEQLYGRVCPEKILAAPAAFRSLGDALLDGQTFEDFLKWCGVSRLPQKTTKSCWAYRDPAFLAYLRQQLRYPARFDESFTAHTPEDLSEANVANCTSFDHLAEILATANPHAVVAWVALDPRIEALRAEGDRSAQLYPSSRHTVPRSLWSQPFPSYAIWLLAETAWMPTEAGDLRAPVRCLEGAPLPEDVRAILPRTAIVPDNRILVDLGVDRQKRRAALERVGVRPGLDQLSWDERYDILLEMPDIDPEGRSARTLYRMLVNRTDEEPAEDSPKRRHFLSNGKLWGVQNSAGGYRRPGELYYVDTTVLPPVVTRQLPLLDLDRKRGAPKIRRIFGATPLDSRNLAMQISTYDEHPRADDLRAEVERLKPYVFAMRMHADTDATGIARLTALKTRLCRWAEGTATIEEREIAVTIRDAGEMLVVDDAAYLVADVRETPVMRDELIASAIGDIFAAFFGVERSSDFARLASCAPERRAALLARILDLPMAETDQLLDKARARLKVGRDTDDERINTRTWVAPPNPVPPSPPAASGAQEGAGASPPTGGGAVRAVRAEQQPHIPSPPRSVPLRVQATPATSQDRATAARRVTDAARCQELAERFEEAPGQDRFPLPAAHMQGTLAWGCDVLSFDSAADRARFLDPADPAGEELIARFIEVKGRGSERGAIDLEGNELQAAQRYKERYFIYRIFERAPHEFELQSLADPVAEHAAVIYRVDLSQAPSTTRWSVNEIME